MEDIIHQDFLIFNNDQDNLKLIGINTKPKIFPKRLNRFIVSLNEIELIHFERVNLNLENFDLVIVFKDYTRKVEIISSILRAELDVIKNWLTKSNIKFSEGKQRLHWTKIMQKINYDISSFFEMGGWSFLYSDDDVDNSNNDDDSQDYTNCSSNKNGTGNKRVDDNSFIANDADETDEKK